MARNRKNQPAALAFGPALKAFLLCGFIVLCCVGYVWQKKQITELSRQIRSRENQLAALRDKNDKMKKQVATLLSPTALDARAKELKLGLVQPDPANIWRLPEPAVPKAMAERGTSQQVAADKSDADDPLEQ